MTLVESLLLFNKRLQLSCSSRTVVEVSLDPSVKDRAVAWIAIAAA